MTITLLAPDGVAVTAQQERQARAALNGGGFGRPLGGRSGFRLDTASNILTATSTTWTLQPCSAMLDPGASTHQGMYGWASDAVITGGVNAADSTNPRKDIVYIQVNDSSAGDNSGATSAPVLYLAGAPNATPVAPALPARSFLVGTIDVPKSGAGAPTVTLNTTRFAPAGVRLPVGSAAERPPSPHLGQEVLRTDRNNHVQRWNGTAWKWVSEPERYVEQANVFDTTITTSSMVIRTMTNVPTRSYATQIRVRSMAAVGSGAISTGALRLVFACSAGVSQVNDAQAKAYMSFSNPGSYFETCSVETGTWIPIVGGQLPLVRCWIERYGPASAVTHQVAINPPGSGYLEALVLPADD